MRPDADWSPKSLPHRRRYKEPEDGHVGGETEDLPSREPMRVETPSHDCPAVENSQQNPRPSVTPKDKSPDDQNKKRRRDGRRRVLALPKPRPRHCVCKRRNREDDERDKNDPRPSARGSRAECLSAR